jgi:hypothetical protein
VAGHLATEIGAAVLGWRGVAAQGDRRGGVALGWCGDWLVVALRKRNTKSVD